MVQYHQKIPPYCYHPAGAIGRPPTATQTGLAYQRVMNHLINYRMGQLLFATSGPPDTSINAADGTFYVVLNGPARTDAADRDRNLFITWMGWPTVVGTPGGGADSAYIKFKPPGGAAKAVYNLDITGGQPFSPTIGYGDKLSMDGAYIARTYTDDTAVVWTPTGGPDVFELAEIETQNYQIAALSVWEAPAQQLTDAQVEITAESVSGGMVIKGKDASNLSLGGIIHKVGDGTNFTESMERSTRRQWSWGHNKGIFCDDTAYEYLFGSGTGAVERFELKWIPRTLASGGETVECMPFAVVTATNNGGDCYLKFTNSTTADTWTWTGNNKSSSLIDFSDGSPATGLDFDSSQYNFVDIEVKVDAGEEMRVKTVGWMETCPWAP